MITQTELQQKDRSDQLRVQMEMMRNEQDNHQKQMTELLKNRDDNETKKFIEQMKQELSSLPQQTAPQQPDLAPQLQQLNMMLNHLGSQQTNEALTSVMDGLRATVETLNKPKMLIKGPDGKTIGVQSA